MDEINQKHFYGAVIKKSIKCYVIKTIKILLQMKKTM